MYDSHYNYILKKYKRQNVKLLFTDTDSLCYNIQTHDIYIYKDLYKDKDLFDNSDYNPSSKFLFNENKKNYWQDERRMRGNTNQNILWIT